jgi:hypothetical protein
VRLQVETTAGIEVGQWVRVFALERYQGPRRRQLLADGAKPALSRPQATAGAGTANGTAGTNAKAGAAQSPRFLPLTPTLLRQSESARLMDLDEASEGSPGVNAAASRGSLDAYLYGELDGAPSGKSE